MIPAEPRERHQQRVVAQAFAGDTDIRPTVLQQHFNFLRRALDKLQTHLRKKFAERLNHRRQAVARLGVGGGNGKHAGGVIGEEIRQATHVAGLVEDPLSDGEQCLTRLRHAEQPLAATDKDLYAQLLLQLADMAADAGLRGIKHIGDLGQVVVPPGRLTDNFKLLEIHDSLRRI